MAVVHPPKKKSTKRLDPGTTGGSKKVVASNRKVFHDYEIVDTFEAGIVLLGSEVKSLRDGKVQLKDAYARLEGKEMLLVGVNISPYAFAQGFGAHTPERMRKLLLNRHEITELAQRSSQEGLSILPLSVYFTNGRAKVEIGLGRGRRQHDKRNVMADRDAKRDIDRAMSDNLRKVAARKRFD